jgi:hypothetical protein
MLTGRVIGRCSLRKRTGGFLKFMNQILKRYPGALEIHVILDNLSTHNNDEAGLAPQRARPQGVRIWWLGARQPRSHAPSPVRALARAWRMTAAGSPRW